MTPEIEKRIKAVQAGRVPAGYCSIVGITMPKEWNLVKLGSIFGNRIDVNHSDYELLSITADKGVIPRSLIADKDNSSEDKSKYKHICVGDIGYNTMRMWQGVCALSAYDGIVSPAYTILAPSDGICASYFAYLFKMQFMINLFYRNSQGLVDDTRCLKYEWFKNIEIKIPPISEQKKIAEILATQDRVIELKEKLIAEKQSQKKYLMSLLLGDDFKKPFKLNGVIIDKKKWRDVSLSDCCLSEGQYGLNAPACAFKDNLPKYIRITDIDEDGRYNRNSVAYVDVDDYENYLLNENDVLLVRTGSTTGKSYLYDKSDGKLVYAGFLIRFNINPEFVDKRVVYACLNTNSYWKWVGVMSMRSGQPGINATEYSKYRFKIPLDKKEQKAIADVLSAVDEEISLLQKDLEQEKLKKKSLMQLLLTGLVRVNE